MPTLTFIFTMINSLFFQASDVVDDLPALRVGECVFGGGHRASSGGEFPEERAIGFSGDLGEIGWMRLQLSSRGPVPDSACPVAGDTLTLASEDRLPGGDAVGIGGNGVLRI